MRKFQITESPGVYQVKSTVTDSEIIEMAAIIAHRRLQKGQSLKSPQLVSKHLQVYLHDREYEVFGIIFVDSQHQIITTEEIFKGTVDACAVYPREIAKRALQLNAKAVVLFHNHPSGDPRVSAADKAITYKIKSALDILDVNVLDHIIVGFEGTCSFAELGLL
tara:strand:- start:580 stop:1071 length:492 start_codon:yes stop_codon:yes gene_type:complete